MALVVFAVFAFLVGALLGLYFKGLILLPVMTVSLAAIVAIGFKYQSTIGFILFVIFMGITALQMGYLVSSVIGAYASETNEQKRRGIG